MFPKHCLLSCHFNVSPTNAVVKNDVFIFVSVVHLARHLSLFKCNYIDWWLSPCTPLCLSASHYISMCLLCTMCFACMKEWNCISSFARTCRFDYMCAQLNDFDCYLWLWGFVTESHYFDSWAAWFMTLSRCWVHRASTSFKLVFLLACWQVPATIDRTGYLQNR